MVNENCDKCNAFEIDDEYGLNPYWANCTDRDCPKLRIHINVLKIDKEIMS